ncbi:MAG: hypothetical protein RR635_09610, partial [Oscillospiraceae bacterium]
TVTSDSITSLPQPTVLTLEENGKISYSLVEHAVGYTASLYKDDVLVTGTEDTNAETASFLNVMRTQGTGTYTVKLIAIGDKDNFNNSAPKTSSAIVISQLPAPLNLVWNGEAGAWDSAANATGYELQLYKSNVAVGEPISLEKKETYDFSSLLKRKGDYTFTVKAIGGEQSIYLSSQPSVASGVFACTKSGISLAMPTALVSKGDSKRVYLNGFDGYAIREVVYSTPDTTKVDLNAVTGEITIKPDYTPTKGEKITVNAQVKYNDEVLFADSFEQDEKNFIDKTAHTGKSGNPNSYKHSQTNSHWGQKAATAVQGSVGPAGKTITTTAGQTGVVTAWYYDEADPAEIDVKGAQAKFGFSMNAVGKKGYNASGVVYDSATESEQRYYIYRTDDNGAWRNSRVERTRGWHKLQWTVTGTGTSFTIDDAEIYKDNAAVKDIGYIEIMTNWNGNTSHVFNKHFLDDVSVVALNAAEQAEQLSYEVELSDKIYTFNPDKLSFDLANPKNISVEVLPDLLGLSKVMENNTAFAETTDYTVNGNTITFIASGHISKLPVGISTIYLTLGAQQVPVTIDVEKNSERSYYVDANSGNDANTGASAKEAWKTLSKLNQTVFNPGDSIYLHADSVWNEQLVLKGSGTEKKIISLQKYGTNDPNKRPIINGNGTNGKAKYFLFGAETAAYGKYTRTNYNVASGAVEIVNEEYWDISGLEVTNLGTTVKDSMVLNETGAIVEFDRYGGQNRNGIMVMNNYAWTIEERNSANWYNSKKSHIYIKDCYVHDVNSLHQAEDGQKVAGGITIYGNVDDILVEDCTVTRCDSEGIRNAGFHPNGWSWAGYPSVLKVVYRNN